MIDEASVVSEVTRVVVVLTSDGINRAVDVGTSQQERQVVRTTDRDTGDFIQTLTRVQVAL